MSGHALVYEIGQSSNHEHAYYEEKINKEKIEIAGWKERICVHVPFR